MNVSSLDWRSADISDYGIPQMGELVMFRAVKKSPDIQLERMIDAVHQVILGRPVDPPSLKHWSGVLEGDLGRISELLPLIIGSREFAVKLGPFVDRHFKSNDAPYLLEHSQNGEIAKFLSLVLSESVANPIVVDVGANGVEGSNSYDLLRHFGWRGLLIEANPNIIPRIESGFAGLDFKLINTAVSNYEGTADLYLGVADGISSLGERNTSQWGDITGTVNVPVRRLPNILKEHDIPLNFGLLSIDAEGQDLNILNDTIDSGYRPEWIIFESDKPQKTGLLSVLPLSEAVRSNYKISGSTYSNVFLRRVS